MGSIGEYIWHCPHTNCEAHGKTKHSYGRAGRYGRAHLIRVHGERYREPILEKVD